MGNRYNTDKVSYVSEYWCWIHYSIKVFILAIAMLTPSKSSAQCPQDCINFNSFFGKDAGASITAGKSNSFFGQDAGKNNTSGDANSFFGRSAGLNNTTGDANTFFGQSAGNMNTTASYNSFFGQTAGLNNTTGSANSFFGGFAGATNTTGSTNSFFGGVAGFNNTIGYANSFFGHQAGYLNSTGDRNSFFGEHAGGVNTTGSRNSFFGEDAGYFHATGVSNSFFGHSAGLLVVSGDSVVCIGANSGPTSNVSNRLYIDVVRTNDPLIYGEFDNDFVKINGTFEVTAGLTNPSSITLKENFVPVNRMEVLDKISQLDIQEWSYKHDPDVRHVGATAEAFHAAFHLGQGSKTISTIDADGVAFLGIQALREQVDVLREENENLQRENQEIHQLVRSLVDRLEQLESVEHSE